MVVRTSSLMFSLRSRAATWALMVGWVRYSASAAREKLPRSTTETKASSSFISMSIAHPPSGGKKPGGTKESRRRAWREYVGIEPT